MKRYLRNLLFSNWVTLCNDGCVVKLLQNVDKFLKGIVVLVFCESCYHLHKVALQLDQFVRLQLTRLDIFQFGANWTLKPPNQA